MTLLKLSGLKQGVIVIRYDNLAETAAACGVSQTALMGSEVALIRAIQDAMDLDTCFRTETRLTCEDYNCEWRSECCRLVVAWRR